jgi:hypothetical protein
MRSGSSVKEGLVRFLVAAVAIIGLIVAGHAIETQFASSRAVEAAVTPGISAYQIHLDKADIKTLSEQAVPLP